MKREWNGFYLDGQTAARQPALIRLSKNGLEVQPDGAPPVLWPYGEIRQTQGTYSGEPVRLERGESLSESVVISDPGFLEALHESAHVSARRFHNPAFRRARVHLTVWAAFGAAALSVGFYLWGIPAAADRVSERVPTSWEEHLGRGLAETIAPAGVRCEDPEAEAGLEILMERLLAPLDRRPYTFRVWIVDHSLVNAMAAPGGYILVFRGLLDRTDTPEELAGVLAHEAQHILKRHSTKAILRQASMRILIAAVTGDARGASTLGLETAGSLGGLRYSRQAEEESDEEGMKLLLEARIDPKGMIAFFEKLEEIEDRGPAIPSYLSSHPSTHDRTLTLRRLARPFKGPAQPVLDGPSWKVLKSACERPETDS